MLFQNSGTANKRASGGQRLTAGVNDGEDFGSDAGGSGQSVAGGSMNAGCMGFIENQGRVIFFGKIGKFDQGCDVSVHAENAFGDDHFAPGSAGLLTKSVFERVEVEMRIDDFARAGQAHAINQAGVVELVGKNDVILANERREQAKIRSVAGGEKERRLRAGN